jgi:hypothetical protein
MVSAVPAQAWCPTDYRARADPVPVQAPGERLGDLLPMRGADPARPRTRAQAHDADRTGPHGDTGQVDASNVRPIAG